MTKSEDMDKNLIWKFLDALAKNHTFGLCLDVRIALDDMDLHFLD